MNLKNDGFCSWINDLGKREDYIPLNGNQDCDFLIIGAGYTGLSAARKLGEIRRNDKIIICDAQKAGEGASGRNSGYLVDTTLNDGFTSNKELEHYRIKSQIYDLGIKTVKKFIKEYQVDCDLIESGKYFASSKNKDIKILNNFSNTLEKLNFEYKILEKKEIVNRLGTNFYNIALYTKGGFLIHPAKLARAMIDALPNNVILYENTTLLNWKKEKNLIHCEFKNGNIKTKKIIFATNGFLRSLGIKINYNFPISLTASMTRPLTDKEFEELGKPKEWGVLPVRPMGATVRLTKDKRILIRNTAEYRNPMNMSKSTLQKRALKQKMGIKKRFPNLPDNVIESTWSGVVSRTRNSSQIFEEVDKNIFVAGCYNGSGIGVGTLFGEQIAIKATNEISEEINIIKKRQKPNWLPPEPFLSIGVRSRLIYERFKALSET